jgi:dUTP pyrophosphatase
MYLAFKKLSEEAIIPRYAHYGDAGLDLVATSIDKSDTPLYWEYGTDLAAEIPRGFVGLLFPRSSISKTTHQLRNSVGVIDSTYRGEIKLRVSPSASKNSYKIGDRIGQLIIFEIPLLKVVEVEELSDSSRGLAGFGSSGR